MSNSFGTKRMAASKPIVSAVTSLPAPILARPQARATALTSADMAAMVQAGLQVVPDLLKATTDWRNALRDERVAAVHLESERLRIDQTDRNAERQHQRTMARIARADKELEQHGRALDRTFDLADKLVAAGDAQAALAAVQLALSPAGPGGDHP